jgi:hypothetical protein
VVSTGSWPNCRPDYAARKSANGQYIGISKARRGVVPDAA